MKVALLSYPMLFQRVGGLQVQVQESLTALSRLGVEARLVNPNEERLTTFDLVHVFGIVNGNHRIVEVAKALGRPVVVSSLIHAGWSRSMVLRAKLLDRLVGRLSGWEVSTSFGAVRHGLQLADRVIALGEAERDALVRAYEVESDRVRVIPNGIDARFFAANASAFRQQYAISRPFVLFVGAINTRKNQMALVHALEGTGIRIVLIGEAAGPDRALLDALLRHNSVTHIPPLAHDDALLASAYAAASVTALTSTSEAMPLCVLESLAAGTPVVLTKFHQMRLALPSSMLREIDPQQPVQIRDAVLALMRRNVERTTISASVADLSWDRVGAALADCYQECLNVGSSDREAAPSPPPLVGASRSETP
jgi:glycosyltransferase involved in cell wall biosynthesis